MAKCSKCGKSLESVADFISDAEDKAYRELQDARRGGNAEAIAYLRGLKRGYKESLRAVSTVESKYKW